MPDTNRQFTRVKFDGKAVELDYQELLRRGKGTMSWECTDPPLPEFKDALAAFRRDFVKICGFPSAVGADFEITQVSMPIDKLDRRRLIITAKKVVEANGPLNISTPLLVEPGDDAGDGTISQSTLEKMDELASAAADYFGGKRAQLEAMSDEEIQRKGDSKKAAKKKAQQADIEEHIKGADKEAERRIRDREIRAALNTILPPATEWADRDEPFTDNRIAAILLEIFGDVEWIDPVDGAPILGEGKSPGIFKHTPEPVVGGPGVMWHAVRTDNGVPAFWFNIEPTEFIKNPGARAATLRGEPLFEIVRELRGLKAPAPEPAPERVVLVEEQSAGDWARAHYPGRADAGNIAGALAMAVHTLCVQWPDGIEGLRAAAREGRSDGELEELIESYVQVMGKGRAKFGWTETLTKGSDLEYISIEVNTTPPLTIALGKGKGKIKADPQHLIAVMRSVFDIPVPGEPIVCVNRTGCDGNTATELPADCTVCGGMLAVGDVAREEVAATA